MQQQPKKMIDLLNMVLKSTWATGCLLFIFLSSGFISCEEDDALTADRNWQLVWADEFEGPAGQSVNSNNWSYDVGNGCDSDAGCGWGNAELQFYTDRPENVSLDGNGNLAITSIAESYAGASFTSGRITTKGLFDQRYGRIEARIKLPWGPGIWPAFWMLGSNIDEVAWPQCGEIDIMEYRGQEPNVVHGSIHGPGYSGGAAITKKYAIPQNRFDLDYHIFAIEWGEDYIHYFVDDQLYQVLTPEDVPGEWVYNQSFYILLNVAVGGNFVGFPTGDTPFPQTMLVDWVRVYQDRL